MLDALYPLFSIFSFLGFILVLIPLPWHLIQTRIPGIFFYIMWSALACLNQFVNSVVWAEDSILRAPVCYNIMMGASVGIPAATLCINRRLYQIASTNGSLSSNKAELRRSVLIDGLLCVFFPLVYIALQFIVQAHRFDIYEQIGCYPALYNSIPLYFLSTIWPPLISLISFAYGGLALHSSSVLTRRTTLSDSLASASITLPHYLRMLILATLSTLLTLSLGIFTIHSTATSTSTPIHPWRSLSTAPHIDSIPVLVWRSDPRLRVALEFTRWTVPVTAILFFVFSIGFAVEARTSHHHLALNSACTFLLRLGGGKSAATPQRETPSPSASKEKFALGAGVGFTKPSTPTINTRGDISLPAYTSSSGSLTVGSFGNADIDVSRARSFTSTTTSYASDSSHFVDEQLDPHAKPHDNSDCDILIISPNPIYELDSNSSIHTPPPASPSPSPALFILTPASATSFASSTASSGSSSSYGTLPSHVGWHAEAYPASPSSVAHPYTEDGEDWEDGDIGSRHDIEVAPPSYFASPLQL